MTKTIAYKKIGYAQIGAAALANFVFEVLTIRWSGNGGKPRIAREFHKLKPRIMVLVFEDQTILRNVTPANSVGNLCSHTCVLFGGAR